MRLPNMLDFRNEFEYWRPIFSQDPGGGTIITYQFVEKRKGMLVNRGGGQLVLITKEQMDIDAEVRKVKDPRGVEMFVLNGQPYYQFVTSVDPYLNIWGELVAWQHKLARAAE